MSINTVQIGSIKMGKDYPIVIQSMTNTDTSDIKATVAQILELYNAGSEIVRITVNDEAAAKAVPEIVKKIKGSIAIQNSPTRGSEKNIPAIVGDFHFNGNILLKKYPECAKSLDKYRINPGNASDENFREMIEIAIANDKVVRIGVNGGSLDQKILDRLMEENSNKTSELSADEVFIKAMVESVLSSARLAESYGLPKNKIVISGKVSEVNQMISVYEKLDKKSDYVLHLGLTEAGGGDYGIISSSIALGTLLQKGIGNTIRVSLTPTPETSRSKEVEVCKIILQSLGLKNFRPKVTSCPGCGRTTSTFFQKLAQNVNKKIDENIEDWLLKYPGVEDLKIAVMGCIVNGPGEAKYADIAIALPGKMEKPTSPVYINGKLFKNLKGDDIEEEFLEILERYIERRFAIPPKRDKLN